MNERRGKVVDEIREMVEVFFEGGKCEGVVGNVMKGMKGHKGRLMMVGLE